MIKNKKNFTFVIESDTLWCNHDHMTMTNSVMTIIQNLGENITVLLNQVPSWVAVQAFQRNSYGKII